jgi:hypothetical protein
MPSEAWGRKIAFNLDDGKKKKARVPHGTFWRGTENSSSGRQKKTASTLARTGGLQLRSNSLR